MMVRAARADSQISAINKCLLLVVLYAGVFALPYVFPVPPSISRSYVAGFSNRAAVLILISGTTLFAWFTHGEIARPGEQDSRLSIRPLVGFMLLALAVCVVRIYCSPDGTPGGDAYYFLNRQQMLAAGLVPYRQFEFIYGPLLLYPNFWASRILQSSQLQAFTSVWVAHWILGVWMIWFVVRSLDIPLPSRTLFFAFLAMAQLVWADFGGLNYTPTRAYAAAFCISVCYRIWKRTRNDWLTALAIIAAVALATACSIEQGVAVAFGTTVYVGLLAATGSGFSWRAVSLALIGHILSFAVAFRLGMLSSVRAFATGGYSYPLLPSFSITVALLTYIGAGCCLYGVLRNRRFDSIVIPLTSAGAALLPTALGRCDILHIAAATPAFVVGAASLYGMPSLRRWWAVLAVLALIVVPTALRRSGGLWSHVPGFARVAKILPHADPREQDLNQQYVSAAGLTADSLPCDRTYFAPSFMPVPTMPINPACLDTGYYLGTVDVISPAAIQAKVDEMRQRPNEPLLMEDIPLEVQFPPQLTGLVSLYRESGAFWVPRRRNVPLTFAPIVDYIRSHYVPGPEAAGGELRIWYPADPQNRETRCRNR